MASNQKTQQNKNVQQNAKVQKPKEHKNQPLNAAQVRSAPETLRGEDVLKAQQQLGNETVQRSLGSTRQDASATDEQGYLSPEISQAIQNKRGSGSALPGAIKDEGKKTLGHDFDDVRIHTDENANKISQKINARAFTIGKDIFFKKGTFSPTSAKGRETLLHELTHVVQQSGAAPSGGKLKLGAPDTAHEKEAESLSKKNAQTAASVAGNANGATVQREGDEDDYATRKEKLMQRSKMRKMAGIELPGHSTPEKSKESIQISKTQEKKQGITPDALQSQIKKMGVGSKENVGKLSKIDEAGSKKTQENLVSERKETKEQQRQKLLSTIKDTTSSEEDVQSARSKLGDLHGSKSNDFSKIFGKDQDSKAMGTRRSALKDAAARGEEGAYDKYQEFRKANPTKKEKVSNFFSGAKNKISGFAKEYGTKENLSKGFGALSTGLGKLFGISNDTGDKKEEAPAPAPGMTINMGGGGGMGMGGGGGMGTIMQEYARVLEENKSLKEQLKAKGEE